MSFLKFSVHSVLLFQILCILNFRVCSPFSLSCLRYTLLYDRLLKSFNCFWSLKRHSGCILFTFLLIRISVVLFRRLLVSVFPLEILSVSPFLCNGGLFVTILTVDWSCLRSFRLSLVSLQKFHDRLLLTVGS